jgi:hypothetical protein
MNFTENHGLVIAQSNPSTLPYPHVQITSFGINVKQSATSYTQITSSSMNIYAPVNDAATKVASFGSTIYLGRTNDLHLRLTTNSIEMYDKNGLDQFFAVKDLRTEEDGTARITETFLASGTSRSFNVNLLPETPVLQTDNTYKYEITAKVDNDSVTVSQTPNEK